MLVLKNSVRYFKKYAIQLFNPRSAVVKQRSF